VKALIVVGLAACSTPRPVIESCASPLGGNWFGPSGEWAIIDTGAKLEAFPVFPDAPVGSPGVIAAPRAIDLDATKTGNVSRRYVKGAVECTTRAPAKIVACKGETIELVLGEPREPAFVDGGACAQGATPPSHREVWRRR